MKYFALLTNQGAAILANAAALGTKVNITAMAVGDGGGTLPTPDAAQTRLVGEKRRAQLNSLTIDTANSSQIIAEQVIPEGEGGFWIREIGLFDADGVMIAVANCAETYKPQLAEGSGRTQTVRMIIIVNSTSAVTLKIDPAVVLATRKYVEESVIVAKQYADTQLEQARKYNDDQLKAHSEAANPHPQYLLAAKRGVKRFDISGKFTVPEGVTEVYLSGCAGAGGGGAGGCRTNTSEFGGGGGGGGAGQPVIKQAVTVKPGEVIDVLIGSGGIGGRATANAGGSYGGDGGDTKFGSYLTLTAGSGGVPGGGGSGNAGGAGGNGYPRGSSGNDGIGSGASSSVIGSGGGGAGASGPYGGGGGGVRSSSGGSAAGNAGYPAYGYGVGGGGGSTGINGAGGTGAPGLMIVEW